MALRRRTGESFRMGIWPGFVDAMTAMLLVFTFVLSVFMMTQYFLRETIEGQEEEIVDKDSALSSLSSQLDSLSTMLALEQGERAAAETRETLLRASLADLSDEKTAAERRLEALAADLTATETERDDALREAAEKRALEALAATLRGDLAATEAALNETASMLSEAERAQAVELAAADALRKRLADSETELTAMELALDGERAKAEETLLLLAAAQEAEGMLKETLGDTSANLQDKDLMLALARSELATLEEASAEERKQIALLNQQTRALREQLSAIAAELEISEGEAERQGAELASLGERLNTALAEKNALLAAQVDQLSDVRSEFFDRVRAVLEGREDIIIRGDRFVFQSEVLFEPASADLNEEGIEELGRFAEILTDIAREIPGDVDWILRIDGHTDRRSLLPGRTRFADNWELSQARALSVARYLIENHNIPPRRLAPTGFGEYRPLTRRNTAEAYATNRRIELKLTQR